MQNIVGGAVLPFAAELVSNDIQEEKLLTAVKQTAMTVCSLRPQTIVLIAGEKTAAEESVRIDMQPRIKSSMEPYGRPDLVIGFETDSLLMRSILHQAEKLGIPVENEEAEHPVQVMPDARFSVPFYFLQQAGFRGQVVHIRCQNLSYEEMYTFGKSVQIAAGKAKKRTAVIASAAFFSEIKQDEAAMAFVEEFADLSKAADLKKMLQLDRQKMQEYGEEDVPLLFFLLGAWGKDNAVAQYFYGQDLAQGCLAAAFACKERT